MVFLYNATLLPTVWWFIPLFYPLQSIISQSVDDRTPTELGCHVPRPVNPDMTAPATVVETKTAPVANGVADTTVTAAATAAQKGMHRRF